MKRGVVIILLLLILAPSVFAKHFNKGTIGEWLYGCTAGDVAATCDASRPGLIVDYKCSADGKKWELDRAAHACPTGFSCAPNIGEGNGHAYCAPDIPILKTRTDSSAPLVPIYVRPPGTTSTPAPKTIPSTQPVPVYQPIPANYPPLTYQAPSIYQPPKQTAPPYSGTQPATMTYTQTPTFTVSQGKAFETGQAGTPVDLAGWITNILLLITVILLWYILHAVKRKR